MLKLGRSFGSGKHAGIYIESDAEKAKGQGAVGVACMEKGNKVRFTATQFGESSGLFPSEMEGVTLPLNEAFDRLHEAERKRITKTS